MLELKRNLRILADRLHQPALHRHRFTQQPPPVDGSIHGNRLRLVCFAQSFISVHPDGVWPSSAQPSSTQLNLHKRVAASSKQATPFRLGPLHHGSEPSRNFVLPVILLAARDLR